MDEETRLYARLLAAFLTIVVVGGYAYNAYRDRLVASADDPLAAACAMNNSREACLTAASRR